MFLTLGMPPCGWKLPSRVISPVVVWGGGRLDPRPAPDEVVAAYRVGLHQLQRDDSPRFISIPESSRPVVQIPLGNDLIHAPTGAVLVQFRRAAIEGVCERVPGRERRGDALAGEQLADLGPHRCHPSVLTRVVRRIGDEDGDERRHGGRDVSFGAVAETARDP